MARRTEKVKARASARLLEDDLKTMRSRLHGHAQALAENIEEESPASANRLKIARAALADSLTLASWQEHRPLLAETLESNDWYDLTSAYGWVETTQLFAGEADLPKISDVLVASGLQRIDAGIRALERLAGRPQSQLEPQPLPDHLVPGGRPTALGRATTRATTATTRRRRGPRT